jgi:alkylation response protein AidB-like acyl-CoA dehydrogenase
MLTEKKPTEKWSPLGAARSLEKALADPLEADFAAAVRADAASAFPQELCAAAIDWGFAEYLIPEECGGRLRSLEEIFLLSRVMSRRDLTATIALGASLLASLPVWLRGSIEQKMSAAELLRRGDFLAFALSEREHGADVVAGEVTARPAQAGDGWRIDGTKWLINNAGHAAAASVTARTGNGVRGLTIFFLLRAQADERQWVVLPKIRSHGLRGSAFSGLTFSGMPTSDTDVIGKIGQGLELVLETLQISRVLVASFALGALDTCLRAVLDFARTRQLYGAPIVELEPVGRRLTDAYAELLIGETLAHAACRAAHFAPEQLPLMSACVKYLVPQLATDSIESLGVVLGARSYLTSEHWQGIVEKMRRDCAVTTLFDGSAPVNLNVIADHLPSLALARAAATVAGVPPELFSSKSPDPSWVNADDIELETDSDGIIGGIAGAYTALADERESDGIPHGRDLLRLLAGFADEIARLDARVTHASSDGDWPRSGEAYDLAARYSHMHAAGACARKWLSWRLNTTDEFITSGAWLVFCLRRLAERIGWEPATFDEIDHVALARIERAYDDQLLFSDFRVPLGRPRLKAGEVS